MNIDLRWLVSWRGGASAGIRSAVVMLLVPAAARAAGDALDYSLVAPREELTPGARASVEMIVLNRTDGEIAPALPATIDGTIAAGANRWPVAVALEVEAAAAIPPQGFSVVRLSFEVPDDASGSVELALEKPAPMRAVLTIAAPSRPGAAAAESAGGGSRPSRFGQSARPTAIAHLRNHYAANFAVYEPMYFLYGPDAPAAKFQFSFRYQLAAHDSWLDRKAPWLRGVMFGYTQRTVWDIRGDSSPFYDTSYLPEIGYAFLAPEPDGESFFTWLGWQAAVQHESNAKSGPDSRSLNTLFVRPAFALGDLEGWHLLVAPRLQAYLSTSMDNHDIDDFRGYGELRFIVGRNDGPALAFAGRSGRQLDRGAIQVDLTIPTSLLSSSLASFFHVQYWNGYGESLLDYNKRSDTVRFGFSLVR